MTKLVIAACVAVSILAAPRAIPQEPDHRHDGGALGEVNFPTSCNAEAQKRFNTVVALLYSFYWEKIDRGSRKYSQADPTCAMAYWAKAVASLDNPLGSPPTPKLEQQGWAAVDKAKRLGAKTEREQDYIAPSKSSSKITRPCHSRPRRRVRDRAGTAPHALPGRLRGRGSLCVLAPGHGEPQRPDLCAATEERENSRKVFARQPNHPGVAHFLIHAYDFRLSPSTAERGQALRLDRAGFAACAAHAVAHLLARRPVAGFDRYQRQIARRLELRSRRVSRAGLPVYAAFQLARDRTRAVGRVRRVRTEAERADAPDRLCRRGDPRALCARTRGLGRGLAARTASDARKVRLERLPEGEAVTLTRADWAPRERNGRRRRRNRPTHASYVWR